MSRKPLIYTAIAAPIFATVSIPLAFIVGAFALAAVGTNPATVGAGNAVVGFVAGGLTLLVFLLYGSYATYNHTSEKYAS